jgi:hypothetical protein
MTKKGRHTIISVSLTVTVLVLSYFFLPTPKRKIASKPPFRIEKEEKNYDSIFVKILKDPNSRLRKTMDSIYGHPITKIKAKSQK